MGTVADELAGIVDARVTVNLSKLCALDGGADSPANNQRRLNFVKILKARLFIATSIASDWSRIVSTDATLRLWSEFVHGSQIERFLHIKPFVRRGLNPGLTLPLLPGSTLFCT